MAYICAIKQIGRPKQGVLLLLRTIGIRNSRNKTEDKVKYAVRKVKYKLKHQ